MLIIGKEHYALYYYCFSTETLIIMFKCQKIFYRQCHEVTQNLSKVLA